MVAATVNGKNIMLAEVERTVSQQAGGKQSRLSQLELAQARLQVLGSLIQREVLFQRAEREKLLPTEEQITAAINQQKQQSGMTDEDFYKNNPQQFVSARGAALAVIIVDPADNSAAGIQNDAKTEAEAKLKIDNVYQQLKAGADFATVARSKSEDAQSLVKGG